MKLQKYMASCGIASRRSCENLIREGKVTLNGETATVGVNYNEGDSVVVFGKQIFPEAIKEYILLFKPVGFITTAKDERGRQTVLDIIKSETRVYPVGRLDVNTSGLLLLTNDGDLANRLTHPRFQVSKTYKALLKGEVTQEAIQKLCDGVLLEDGMTSPARAKMIKFENGKSIVEITIKEGRNRQVRRMFEAVGYNVLNLRRTSLGKLTLGGMEKGQYRNLEQREIDYLYSLCK